MKIMFDRVSISFVVDSVICSTAPALLRKLFRDLLLSFLCLFSYLYISFYIVLDAAQSDWFTTANYLSDEYNKNIDVCVCVYIYL